MPGRITVCLLVLLSPCGLFAAEPAAAEKSLPKPPAVVRVTRTAGEDWPAFLGPRANSKSIETGILKQWPETGPKLVWQTVLGVGYGMPTIANGRLFQADRMANQVRVRCLESETGKPLWTFQYPSEYTDLY